MKNNTFIAIIVSLLLLLLIIMMCRDVRPPEIPPTLAISETPSITPAPPTATPSPTTTVILVTSTPPAGETAVVPSLTPAAVSPTSPPIVPTKTPTPEPPTPTPTDELLLIEKGVTYWDSSKYKYDNFECWQFLKRVNGWPERALPIGETMRLPGTC